MKATVDKGLYEVKPLRALTLYSGNSVTTRGSFLWDSFSTLYKLFPQSFRISKSNLPKSSYIVVKFVKHPSDNKVQILVLSQAGVNLSSYGQNSR